MAWIWVRRYGECCTIRYRTVGPHRVVIVWLWHRRTLTSEMFQSPPFWSPQCDVFCNESSYTCLPNISSISVFMLEKSPENLAKPTMTLNINRGYPLISLSKCTKEYIDKRFGLYPANKLLPLWFLMWLCRWPWKSLGAIPSLSLVTVPNVKKNTDERSGLYPVYKLFLSRPAVTMTFNFVLNLEDQ